MCAHRQNRIQHQNSLLRPVNKIPVVRHVASHIIVKLAVNVDQRRRNHRLLRQNGKAKAMGLLRLMIRILSQNHNLHMFQRRQMKRIENILCRRINGLRLILFADK